MTRRGAGALVEELREAINTGLLVDDDGLLVFRHQLVRDAVYGAIPTGSRASAPVFPARRKKLEFGFVLVGDELDPPWAVLTWNRRYLDDLYPPQARRDLVMRTPRVIETRRHGQPMPSVPAAVQPFEVAPHAGEREARGPDRDSRSRQDRGPDAGTCER